MYTSKVEIALGRYIGNVRCYALLLAYLPDDCGHVRLIDGRQDHCDVWVVQVCRFESFVQVLDLLLINAVCDFIVETFARTEEGDFCVGIEEVQNSACRYLSAFTVNVNSFRHATEMLQRCATLTSPPPITRTFLFLTCQARISDPPPLTAGNS